MTVFSLYTFTFECQGIEVLLKARNEVGLHTKTSADVMNVFENLESFEFWTTL